MRSSRFTHANHTLHPDDEDAEGESEGSESGDDSSEDMSDEEDVHTLSHVPMETEKETDTPVPGEADEVDQDFEYAICWLRSVTRSRSTVDWYRT